MAKDSRYTEATHLAQADMQKVIDSFGEDTPFMSDGVSARTEARRAKLADAPADIRGLLDSGFPQYFVERLLTPIPDPVGPEQPGPFRRKEPPLFGPTQMDQLPGGMPMNPRFHGQLPISPPTMKDWLRWKFENESREMEA